MEKKSRIESSTGLKLKANTLRKHVVEMLSEAGSGHTAGSLGLAEVFSTLYFNIMSHDPENPGWEDRDFLILSNGHVCPVQYATLAEAGYFPKKELFTLRQIDSRLQGHPHNLSLPGIENSGGPLGQGISQAAGLAKGLKIDGRENTVFCVCGDGELNEGQVWEAMLFAGKNNLSNLVQVVDRNNIQIDGFTEDVLPLEPLKEKFEAFNYEVFECDGNSVEELLDTFRTAIGQDGDGDASDSPKVIIAETTPGKGASFAENSPEWHGRPPSEKQAEEALEKLRTHRQKLKDEL